MDDCTIDCIEIIGNFSSAGSCNFAKEYCVQSTIQVIQGYYCLANGSFVLLLLTSLIMLLMVYYAINTAADSYLVPCLEEFIVKLNMSDALAGITFLALANGTPNVITAVAAGASSSASTLLIPFGSIFGSSMFSMGFILSTIVLISPNGLTFNLHETLVPLGFYLIGTIYLIIVSLSLQKMNVGLALAFLSLYPIYIIIVLIEERRRKKNKSEDKESQLSINQKIDDVYQEIIHEQQEEDEEEKEGKRGFFGRVIHFIRMIWMFLFSYTVPVVLKEDWKPTNVVVALLFSPIILYLVKGIPQVFEESLFSVPYAVWFSLPSILLLSYSIYSINRKEKPKYTMIFNLYSFVVIVSWIASIIGVLINLMQLLQILTQINPIFLGLTVFAWISSIGDYFSITSFTKRGYISTATAGIFSGQLLDFLIGFGLSCLVRATKGEYYFDIFVLGESKYQKVSDLIVLVVIGLAFCYMVTLFLVLIIKKGKLQKSNSTFARIFYFSFVVVGLLMSLTTDFFKEYECIFSN